MALHAPLSERRPLLLQASNAARTSRERSVALAHLARLEDLSGAPSAVQTFQAAIDAAGPPDDLTARRLWVWHTLPLSRSAEWWARAEAVLAEGDRLHDTMTTRAMLMSASVIWDDAPDPESDPELGSLAGAVQMLRAIQKDDAGHVERILTRGGWHPSMADWLWTCRWWLEANGPEALWTDMTQRWPAAHTVPVGRWVLGRAAIRAADPTRRSAILAARMTA